MDELNVESDNLFVVLDGDPFVGTMESLGVFGAHPHWSEPINIPAQPRKMSRVGGSDDEPGSDQYVRKHLADRPVKDLKAR